MVLLLDGLIPKWESSVQRKFHRQELDSLDRSVLRFSALSSLGYQINCD